MAFRFRRDDPRGNPRIIKIEGKWEAHGDYFTDQKKLADADAWCAWANMHPYLRQLTPWPQISPPNPTHGRR